MIGNYKNYKTGSLYSQVGTGTPKSQQAAYKTDAASLANNPVQQYALLVDFINGHNTSDETVKALQTCTPCIGEREQIFLFDQFLPPEHTLTSSNWNLVMRFLTSNKIKEQLDGTYFDHLSKNFDNPEMFTKEPPKAIANSLTDQEYYDLMEATTTH